MSLVPPEDYDNHSLSITMAGSSQLTQPARRNRGGIRSGRGAGTRRQSTALPFNSSPNADNVFINSRRHSDHLSIPSDQQQPPDTVTLSRSKFEILQARLLTLETQVLPKNTTVFQSVEAREEGLNTNSFDRSRPFKHGRKTAIKLPNPNSLFDEVTSTFETWKGQALRKLQVNSWLFPDETTKFAWIASLVSSDAQLILEPYILSSNPLAFTIAQKVFDHLRLSFSDPDKVGTAKNALERL
jgi:hypothetical protein